MSCNLILLAGKSTNRALLPSPIPYPLFALRSTVVADYTLSSRGLRRHISRESPGLRRVQARKHLLSIVLKFWRAKENASRRGSYQRLSGNYRAGRYPKSAASIALNRLLKMGRDPFASQISLQIPYGHAAHFSKYGNFDSLPVLNC